MKELGEWGQCLELLCNVLWKIDLRDQPRDSHPIGVFFMLEVWTWNTGKTHYYVTQTELLEWMIVSGIWSVFGEGLFFPILIYLRCLLTPSHGRQNWGRDGKDLRGWGWTGPFILQFSSNDEEVLGNYCRYLRGFLGRGFYRVSLQRFSILFDIGKHKLGQNARDWSLMKLNFSSYRHLSHFTEKLFDFVIKGKFSRAWGRNLFPLWEKRSGIRCYIYGKPVWWRSVSLFYGILHSVQNILS